MSCLFFTALWLHQSQFVLVQEIQPAKDIDLTCYKTLPIKATTCLQVGPMSLEWSMCPVAGSDQSSFSSSHEDPNDEHQEGTRPASSHSRWRRDALQPPQIQHGTAGRDTCGHFPDGGSRCIIRNAGGLVGSVVSSHKNRSSNFSGNSLTTTCVSRRYTGWMSFYGLSFLVLSFLVTRTQEERPLASSRIFCLKRLDDDHQYLCLQK